MTAILRRLPSRLRGRDPSRRLFSCGISARAVPAIIRGITTQYALQTTASCPPSVCAMMINHASAIDPLLVSIFLSVVGTLHNKLAFSRRVRVLSEHFARLVPRGASVLDVGCGDG